MKIVAFLVLALLFTSCANEEIRLAGSVFLVTEGSENVKLGAVKLQIISESKFLPYKEQHEPALKAEFRDTEQGRIDCINYMKGMSMSAEYLVSCVQKVASRRAVAFDSFLLLAPAPDAKATTDAEGTFFVRLPKRGKYFVVAKSVRPVFDGTENMYWILPIEADGGSEKVVLSNANMYRVESTGVTQ